MRFTVYSKIVKRQTFNTETRCLLIVSILNVFKNYKTYYFVISALYIIFATYNMLFLLRAVSGSHSSMDRINLS